MLKDTTLSVKISIGFGILILIAFVLGMVAIVNMKTVEHKSTKLAYEYAPEVEMANGMERNYRLAMYNMRGYGLTGNENYLRNAKDNISKVKVSLNEAKMHGVKYPALVKLIQGVTETEKALVDYEKLMDETEQINIDVKKERAILDEAAGLYMKSCNSFLANQNNALDKEINSGTTTIIQFQERHDKISWINDIIDVGNDTRVKNFKAQAIRDTSIMKNALTNFSKMDDLLRKIRTITRKPFDISQLNEIEKSKNEYQNGMKSLLKDLTRLQELAKERDRVGTIVVKAAESISRAGVNITNQYSKEAAEELSSASSIMITGLIIALILGVIIAILIIRSITKPIIIAVQTISDGNSQVVSASNEISSSSIALAEGATQQASAVEEVSATVEESTAINNQNAENSREANTLATTANESASLGNEKIKDLMTSMEGISTSSEQIAKIIKTIDEIAFQTNLLALNAAVEAARAGEHGLGFAVVAEEVKNLAQRSANAAKETADIIEESIEQIKNGNTIAQETNEAFEDIVDKVQKTSNIIGEISTSVNEQAEGMNQVASAMGQIDEITQQNAASSEEAAAAAEELNAQALSMLDSVAEIAKMVGIDVNTQSATHTSTTRRVSSKPKQISHITHKSQTKPKSKKQQPPKATGHDDVFPLDEGDLKHF